ncbi:MAG: hypothetical protein O7B99_00720, partial [Planctomycetota bacterium]|nr:hypothetical protein [Planctomycetota bacterium]
PRRVELRVREPRRLATALVEFDDVLSVRFSDDDGLVAVETRDVDGFCDRLTKVAARERVGIREMESVDAGLEAVFDYLVE